jgi:hypothetical protein
MSVTLFQRKATLVVGGRSVEGLRVAFKAGKSLQREPNRAEVTVWNLSETSRRSMQSRGTPVLLQAGYETTQAIVFSGYSRLVEHRLDGADWVTRIEAGDGDVPLTKPVRESFKGGTTGYQVVDRIASALGIDTGNLAEHAGTLTRAQYTNGYAANGSGAQELGRVLGAAGLTFSIQDGRLRILAPRQSTSEMAYVLSAATGLVGVPEHGSEAKPGEARRLKVKALLLPQVLPGRRIQLDARAQKGVFRVVALTHVGDTHQGDWHTEMEVVPA